MHGLSGLCSSYATEGRRKQLWNGEAIEGIDYTNHARVLALGACPKKFLLDWETKCMTSLASAAPTPLKGVGSNFGGH